MAKDAGDKDTDSTNKPGNVQDVAAAVEKAKAKEKSETIKLPKNFLDAVKDTNITLREIKAIDSKLLDGTAKIIDILENKINKAAPKQVPPQAEKPKKEEKTAASKITDFFNLKKQPDIPAEAKLYHHKLLLFLINLLKFLV